MASRTEAMLVPFFSGSSVLDTIGGGEERCYVLLACLEQQPDDRWAKKQADALCAELACTSVGEKHASQNITETKELTLEYSNISSRTHHR